MIAHQYKYASYEIIHDQMLWFLFFLKIQVGRVLPCGFKLHMFRIYKAGEKQKQDKCPEKETLEGGVENCN